MVAAKTVMHVRRMILVSKECAPEAPQSLAAKTIIHARSLSVTALLDVSRKTLPVLAMTAMHVPWVRAAHSGIVLAEVLLRVRMMVTLVQS
jgi:hypothetical protein